MQTGHLRRDLRAGGVVTVPPDTITENPYPRDGATFAGSPQAIAWDEGFAAAVAVLASPQVIEAAIRGIEEADEKVAADVGLAIVAGERLQAEAALRAVRASLLPGGEGPDGSTSSATASPDCRAEVFKSAPRPMEVDR